MKQQKINLTILKQYLKNASQEELILDITELFKNFPAVKDYYQIKLYPQEEKEIAAKYKKIIEEQFFPSRGFGKAKLSVAKKAISDYKKVGQSQAALIDIMLFYVEQGVKFTNAYGDIDEQFYLSMEGVYEQVVEIIIKANLKDIFQERCQKIMEDTSDIGWGFHDMLTEIYEEAF
ncbi:MAG: DUF6155 family protein [Microcoleaceae cyanobacterium]